MLANILLIWREYFYRNNNNDKTSNTIENDFVSQK